MNLTVRDINKLLIYLKSIIKGDERFLLIKTEIDKKDRYVKSVEKRIEDLKDIVEKIEGKSINFK